MRTKSAAKQNEQRDSETKWYKQTNNGTYKQANDGAKAIQLTDQHFQ